VKINELVHIRLELVGIEAAGIAIGHIGWKADIATDTMYMLAVVMHNLGWVIDILPAMRAHLIADHVAVVVAAGAAAKRAADRVGVMRSVVEAQEADYMVKMVVADMQVEAGMAVVT
jgi:hypothetical protein